MASGFKNVGIGKGIFTDDGACKLILQGDGRLHMIVSGTDMGQGFRTAMTQIAAETLGMDIADIYITNGDTELTIPTGESVSERQTLCGGRAVYEACVKLKQDLDSRPWRPGEERRAEYYYASDPCFAIGDFEGAKKRGAKYRNFRHMRMPRRPLSSRWTRRPARFVCSKSSRHTMSAAPSIRISSRDRCTAPARWDRLRTDRGLSDKERLSGQDAVPPARSAACRGYAGLRDYFNRGPGTAGSVRCQGHFRGCDRAVTPAIINAVSRAIGVRINKVPASPEVVLEAIRTGKCEVPTMEQQLQALKKDCECHRPSDGVQ